MKFEVTLTDEAKHDLIELHEFVAEEDSLFNADHLLDRLETLCESLANQPQRGHVPPELSRLGVIAFREIHFKPYRVIYAVDGRRVHIVAVVDGRRDMQSFLMRRLQRF